MFTAIAKCGFPQPVPGTGLDVHWPPSCRILRASSFLLHASSYLLHAQTALSESAPIPNCFWMEKQAEGGNPRSGSHSWLVIEQVFEARARPVTSLGPPLGHLSMLPPIPLGRMGAFRAAGAILGTLAFHMPQRSVLSTINQYLV